MNSIISAVQVSKRFRVPQERRFTIVDHLSGISSILGRRRFEAFWAIQKITFNLAHGESLGIIGPNGSGKSTLLKLIANIMKPDRGSLNVNGAIAPILELGVGFHRELTVRENALVYGVIMGLRRSDMKNRIHDILDFAGLARFQDVELKKLSSGMQVRLAFSIAVQTEADILLVDEALAVGDAEFQEKCQARFHDFKKQGKSIILVSHNMELINAFCEKALYLSRGQTKIFGPSELAADLYLQDMRAERQRT